MPQYSLKQYAELLGEKVGKNTKLLAVIEERLSALEKCCSNCDSQKDEMVTLLSKVGELQNSVKKLQSDVNALKGDKKAAEASAAVKKLQGEVNALKGDVANLKKSAEASK